MPFLIETTYAIEGQAQGFSETFYWQQATDNLATAEETITPIAQKRAKLLADTYVLAVVRNAIVQNEAGQKVKRVTDIFEPRYPGVAAWKPAAPQMSLMCVWQTAKNTASKKQYMRGIPNGLGDLGKLPDLSYGTFLSYFNSWRASMIALPAGWLVTAPTQNSVINSYETIAGSGNVKFTFNTAFTWPVQAGFNTSIHISLPGKSPLDGMQLVKVIDGTHAYTVKPIGVAPFVPGMIGIAQIRTPTLVTLAAVSQGGPTGSIHPQRIVSHKTGSPSYASRGRRAATVRW